MHHNFHELIVIIIHNTSCSYFSTVTFQISLAIDYLLVTKYNQ